MTKQLILKYFLDQKDAFFKNYRVAIKSANVEAIHDMRVSLKRLNTLIKMLNYSKRANYRLKSCCKSLKVIFKRTGRIRDYQIFEELLNDYQKVIIADYAELISVCNSNEAKLTFVFYNSVQLSDYQRLMRVFNVVEYHLKSKSDDELNFQLGIFTKDCEYRLFKFSNPGSENYNLHKARKEIKNLGYLMEISENEKIAHNELLIRYKETGRLLGNWHDKSILYNYLSSNKQQSFSEIENMDDLLAKLKTDKDELKVLFHSLNV